MLVGEDCIFSTLDAFDNNSHIGHFLEVCNVRPVKAGVNETGEIICSSSATISNLVVIFLIRSLWHIFHPHVFLAAAHLRCIHRHKERLAATLFGTTNEFLSFVAITVHIKLHKVDLIRLSDRSYFLNGKRAESWDHLDDIVISSTTAIALLSVRMSQLRKSRRSNHYRERARVPHNGCVHIDVTDVHHDTWPQPNATESRVIFA
mmetsp:Transcript_21347/g.52265  ORF Transcript_21347/g.52265 Transcript_21347/m.52265 type:complete len:205 (-) Transcript_21347:516-1130(-)